MAFFKQTVMLLPENGKKHLSIWVNFRLLALVLLCSAFLCGMALTGAKMVVDNISGTCIPSPYFLQHGKAIIYLHIRTLLITIGSNHVSSRSACAFKKNISIWARQAARTQLLAKGMEARSAPGNRTSKPSGILGKTCHGGMAWLAGGSFSAACAHAPWLPSL